MASNAALPAGLVPVCGSGKFARPFAIDGHGRHG
jgi:hypothetical protein